MLTPEDYKEFVLGKVPVHLVVFVWDKCSHCKTLEPVFREAFANKQNPDLPVFMVHMGRESYPTIEYVTPKGVKKIGARSLDELESVMDNLR